MPTVTAVAPSDTQGLRPHRACRHCVQIKAKCIPLEGSNNSTCQRLKKECTTPAAIPRKRQKSRATRVSQIEERLQTLTSILTARNGSEGLYKTPDQSLPTPPTSLAAASVQDGPTDEPVLPSATTTEEPAWKLYCKGNGREPSSKDAQQFFQPLAPGTEEKLFTFFRTELSSYFPYVVIPPHVSFADFQTKKPFLCRSCVAAACYADPGLQKQIAEELLRYLGDRMLLKAEKSLDLLQGVLVLIAWYHYYNHFNAQLMNLFHLASSLVADLGLNRPIHVGPWPPVGTVVDINAMIYGKPVKQTRHSTDEIRALLGVYFFAARFCVSLKRFEPMRWTSHLAECCERLAAAEEYASDSYVVELTKLHRLLDRYHDPDGTRIRAPIRSFVKCFEQDIEEFRRGLHFPADAPETTVFRLNVLSVEVALFETVQTADCEFPIQRTEALQTCLERIGAMFDTYTSCSLQCLPALPLTVWLIITQVLIVVAKLSFVNMDGWDVQDLRGSRRNFTALTDCLVGTLEEVAQPKLVDGRPQAPTALNARFAMYAEKMRLCKKWYEKKINAEMQAQNATDGSLPAHAFDPAHHAVLPDSNMLVEGFFDGFEDNMWEEFMGGFAQNINLPSFDPSQPV